MWRGWVLMGVAALAGCARTGEVSSGEGVAGQSGNDGAGGAGSVAGAGSAAGGGAGGAGAGMRPCLVNCCNGDKVAQGDQADAGACAKVAKANDPCADKGGAAKIFLGEQAVFQDLSCDGSCQTSCCDGTVAFTASESQTECELWTGRMCTEEEGGPSLVAHDGTLVWTAGGQCPSLSPCGLTCADGAQQTTPQYQEKVCVAEAVGGAFCAEHGGPATVTFEGQTVWTAP